MLKWFIMQPFMWLITLFCYITNPIVVLFADECGELHGIWRLWQTWDDSCDCSMMVLEKMPKIFRYDFYSKYEEHDRMLTEYNRKQYYVTLKEGATFSIWERFQRYMCRVGWLTRNCAYGFSFYWFGITLTPNKAQAIKNTSTQRFGYNGERNYIWLNTPWTYQDEKLILSIGRYNVYRNFYLGWKFDVTSSDTTPTKYMIANRIAWKIKNENN